MRRESSIAREEK